MEQFLALNFVFLKFSKVAAPPPPPPPFFQNPAYATAAEPRWKIGVKFFPQRNNDALPVQESSLESTTFL